MTAKQVLLRGGALALLAIPTIPFTLPAQAEPRTQAPTRVKRSGPRFGVTWLSGSIVDTLRSKHDIDVSPIITQFGWQYERQFLGSEGGPTAVSEWILLVGGLEQGAFLPSLSWIVGLRTPGNIEFGVGPNATPVGFALVITSGVTFKAGALNIPVNVAVVPSRIGARVSLLTGFNTHR
ncbi:MAG: hypothetical protein WKG32_03880 [Gemmatimonadaceae bacterium]